MSLYLCVSLGQITIYNGICQNIRVWRLSVSQMAWFGSQTFFSITGKHAGQKEKWFYSCIHVITKHIYIFYRNTGYIICIEIIAVHDALWMPRPLRSLLPPSPMFSAVACRLVLLTTLPMMTMSLGLCMIDTYILLYILALRHFCMWKYLCTWMAALWSQHKLLANGVHDWNLLFGPRSSLGAFPNVRWESPTVYSWVHEIVISSCAWKLVIQVEWQKAHNSHILIVLLLLKSRNEEFISNPGHSDL